MSSCFISYSWDSADHKEWVRKLAEKLQKNGIHTYLDQWDVKPGSDIALFMETSIRESEFVLLICTPDFCKKANSGKGGVGYEKAIVSGEMLSNSSINPKFVPIIRSGNPSNALPSYLKSKAYIDFRNDSDYDKQLSYLIRSLYNEPELKRPSLGEKPVFRNIVNEGHENQKSESDKKPISDLNNKLFSFAMMKSIFGLGMNSIEDAEEWAVKNESKFADIKFSAFLELFYLANSRDGLRMSKEKAMEWACSNANSFSKDDYWEIVNKYRYREIVETSVDKCNKSFA